MALQLVLAGNTATVLNRTRYVDGLIDDALKFKPTDAEKDQSFRDGLWDGYVHLYDGRFPIGLLSEVETLLTLQDAPYEVIDKRTSRFVKPIHLRARFTPRDYQVEAVDRALRFRRGVIALPCGGGKTLTALMLIEKLHQPAVIYVHRKELLYQTADTIKKVFGIQPGLVGDGHCKLAEVTVAMIQSVSKLPRAMFERFPVVILDEAHHCPAQQWYDIARATRADYFIGLSATPRREDGREMLIWAGTGPIIYLLPTSTLIEQGFLARPFVHAIHMPALELPGFLGYDNLYKVAVVYNRLRNRAIAQKAVEMSAIGKTYVHVKQIEHGRMLTKLINSMQVPGSEKAIFLQGKDPSKRRNAEIQRFRTGNLGILVSTLLGEGVDIPEMYALVLASGGLSETFVRQVFGRLLRISDHDIVEFWDIADHTSHLYRHWLARARWYLSEPAFMLDSTVTSSLPTARREASLDALAE